jgi:hypothetical protein
VLPASGNFGAASRRDKEKSLRFGILAVEVFGSRQDDET